MMLERNHSDRSVATSQSRWSPKLPRCETNRTFASSQRPASRESTWSKVISSLTRRSPVNFLASSRPAFDELAKRNLSFADPSLLRSSTSNQLLHRWGRLLDKEYEADHDKLSKVDTSLDVFVSHNWSTDSRSKYLVLVMHFNLAPAVISWTVWVVTWFIVEAHGLGPRTYLLHHGERVPFGYLCGFAGSFIFLLALLFWHEVSAMLGLNGATIFFDKACVNQKDIALKSQGIKSLAAFIFFSWNMLICYSDVYLKKLWTIYEVATFMMVHPGSVADIRPQFFPVVFLAGFSLILVTELIWFVTLLSKSEICEVTEKCDDVLPRLVFLPCAIGLGIVFRKWIRKMADIPDQLRDFHIRDALVTDERDRLAVQENLVAFMKYYEKVPADAPDHDVFEKFEALVRDDLPKLFKMSLGRLLFPYHVIVVMCLPAVGRALDLIAFCIADRNQSAVIRVLVATCGYVFLFIPLVIYVYVKLAKMTLHLTFFLFLIAEMATGITILACVSVAQSGMLEFLEKQVTMVFVLVVLALLVMAVCWLYRPPTSTRYKRKYNPLENCGVPARKLPALEIKASFSSLSTGLGMSRAMALDSKRTRSLPLTPSSCPTSTQPWSNLGDTKMVTQLTEETLKELEQRQQRQQGQQQQQQELQQGQQTQRECPLQMETQGLDNMSTERPTDEAHSGVTLYTM